MRILAIGLGGAGCRIAAALYANDRKSSKVACVQALAVDVDHETIAKLTALPERSKICFEALDAGLSMNGKETAPTPRIDITEIVARIQNREGEDPDAIIICCGLGGSMTEIAPHLIAALRASVTEPLFGLVTLPCLSEGERRSAKAADDIEAISPLLDGTLLFDNETWVKKVAKRRDTLVKEMSHASEGFLGFGKSQPKLTAREITDKLLNQSIVRRISLILRAGEFRADGGIDLAEVVMDSSEVLNTMMGMGFITIGYAVEYLHNKPLAFLSRLRPENETEEQRKSAERIIDLAKQAIYQEVSIPCDMTSASKALILLAGPSHEISMKGFMTVRSWIDRSIAGMETRSGDYPVTNTKYVAIIVMLSGIENIPRVNQLKEIRDQYRFGGSRSAGSASEPLRDVGQKSDRFSAGSVSDVAASWKKSDISDDMIVMPGSSPKRGGAYDRVQERGTPRNPERERIPSQRGNINTGNPSPYQAGTGARAPREFYQEQPRAPVRERPMVRSEPVQNQRPAPVRPPVNQSVPPVPRHRTLPQEPQGNLRPVPRQQFTTTNPRLPQGNTVRRNLESGYEAAPVVRRPPPVNREAAIRKTERDTIPRQRGIQKPDEGRSTMPARTPDRSVTPHQTQSSPTIQQDRTIVRRITTKKPVQQEYVPFEKMEEPDPMPERKIIRIRKKEVREEESLSERTVPDVTLPHLQDNIHELVKSDTSDESLQAPLAEQAKIGLKGRSQPTKDDIFFGKSIPHKEPSRVRDEALLHAKLKARKGTPERKENRETAEESDAIGQPGQTKKKKVGKTGADEFSWIND